MMSAPQTYGSGTVEFDYDGRYLVFVKMEDAHYRASGHTYEHIWFTNGKVKRMVSKFKQPIALRCYPSLTRNYTPNYKVEVVDRAGGRTVLEHSFESVNSLITHYSVRSDLLEQMVSKMGF